MYLAPAIAYVFWVLLLGCIRLPLPERGEDHFSDGADDARYLPDLSQDL